MEGGGCASVSKKEIAVAVLAVAAGCRCRFIQWVDPKSYIGPYSLKKITGRDIQDELQGY